LRQHHQFGCEALGEIHPQVDAELIALAAQLYREVGLRGLSLQVNSIGDSNCRPAYVERLRAYYQPLRDELCDECKVRLERSPMRLLDCKKPRCRQLAAEAPHMLDYLCDQCHTHWLGLLAALDAIEQPYTVNYGLVRGFDYYTKTVFEFWPARQGAQSTVGGGGRYDLLAELIGGRPTPGIGFASGIERILLTLEEEQAEPPPAYTMQVFVAAMGEEGQRAALPLTQRLRAAGIAAGVGTPGRSLKAQLRAANDSGARFALVLGDDEARDGTVQVKDLAARQEIAVPMGEAVAYVRGRLE
jgi:histidyl-tRNA synthetase